MGGDFCSREGADKLRRRIEEYWSERGYQVDVQLINQGFVPAMRSARTDIRSDMVNGMPARSRPAADRRPAAPAPAAAPQLTEMGAL